MSKERISVKGIAYWAQVQTPSKNDDNYSVELVVDDDTAAKLEGMGAKPLTNQEGQLKVHEGSPGKVFKFKNNSINKKTGLPNKKPLVVDAKRNEIKDLIGNGSTVKVVGSLYHWTFKGRKGVSLNLYGVQVLDLVQYGGGNAESMFEEEEGYTSEAGQMMDDADEI